MPLAKKASVRVIADQASAEHPADGSFPRDGSSTSCRGYQIVRGMPAVVQVLRREPRHPRLLPDPRRPHRLRSRTTSRSTGRGRPVTRLSGGGAALDRPAGRSEVQVQRRGLGIVDAEALKDALQLLVQAGLAYRGDAHPRARFPSRRGGRRGQVQGVALRRRARTSGSSASTCPAT